MPLRQRLQAFATRRPGLAALLLALAHSLLFALAFPPIGVWALAFAAPVPLILAGLIPALSARRAFGAVWLGTLPFWFYEHRWLIDVTVAGYPILNLMMACYPAAFVAILRRASRLRWFAASPGRLLLAAPFVWTGLEMLRGQVAFDGYPFYLLAHPTIDFRTWAGVAALVGAYGVGTLMAGVAAAASGVLTSPAGTPRRRWGGAFAGLGVLGYLAGVFQSGSAVWMRSSGGQAVVAIVQTAVPQSNKMAWSPDQQVADFRRFMEMTRDAARVDDGEDVKWIDLVVWPETMFPGIAMDPAAVEAEREAGLVFRTQEGAIRSTIFHDELLRLQEELGVPMLVGAIGRDGMRVELRENGGIEIVEDAQYNSAFVVAGGEVTDQRYDKIHLTPFGEVMPYISAIEWLENKLLAIGAPGMSFALSQGRSTKPLEATFSSKSRFMEGATRPLRIATPICFEATNPAVVRRLVFDGGERKADVIIQLTNDGWFGRWRGVREQHMQMCRWRAVELRTEMVRAVNTGISAIIRADGRIDARMPDGPDVAKGVDGVLTVTTFFPRRLSKATLYALTGDLLGWLSLGATVGLFGATFVRRWRVSPKMESNPGAAGPSDSP